MSIMDTSERRPNRWSPHASRTWHSAVRLPSLRKAAEQTDRIDDGKGEAHDDDTGYKPPETPQDDHPLSLALKVGVAMVIADTIARGLGFASPTWSVLTAAFLATSPPIASAKAAARKIVAMLVGIALGLVGAYTAALMSGVPSIHFLLVGVVAGYLGTRSPDYLFAAVVGTVVTFVGVDGSDPTMEVAIRTVCMILIGCAVGPVVVWAIERAKRFWYEKRTAKA